MTYSQNRSRAEKKCFKVYKKAGWGRENKRMSVIEWRLKLSRALDMWHQTIKF